MLEIPESQTITRQLNNTIKGKTIENAFANSSPHGFAFYSENPEQYGEILTGKTITLTEAVAGQVEIKAEDMSILLGDGINIRYYAENETKPEKHQLYIQFDDGTALICTIQMYGCIFLYKNGENTNFYYLVAKENPNPLTDDFNEEYFNKILAETKDTLSAKAFLATEQRIPGLGNGILQDILFNARIHPKTKLNFLTKKDIHTLFDSVKKTLFEMTGEGGRDTEKDLFGEVGGYQTILSKKTIKKPCPVCGGIIERKAYLGDNVYYCPTCQPLKK